MSTPCLSPWSMLTPYLSLVYLKSPSNPGTPSPSYSIFFLFFLSSPGLSCSQSTSGHPPQGLTILPWSGTPKISQEDHPLLKNRSFWNISGFPWPILTRFGRSFRRWNQRANALILSLKAPKLVTRNISVVASLPNF